MADEEPDRVTLKSKMSIIPEESINSLQRSSFEKTDRYTLFEGQDSMKLKYRQSEKIFNTLKKKEKLILRDGSEYEGEVENYLPNGYGKQMWKNGDEFLGFFKKGLKNGIGKYIKKNNFEFYGDFYKDNINGYGVMEYFNGDKYDGDFVDGKYEGHGTFHSKNGMIKRGLFKKGEFIFWIFF